MVLGTSRLVSVLILLATWVRDWPISADTQWPSSPCWLLSLSMHVLVPVNGRFSNANY